MKSIVIVNPVRYTGYGYINIIKNFFKDYYLIGLWPSDNHKLSGYNRALHLLDEEIVHSNFDDTVNLLQKYNVQCFLVGDCAAFPLADKLQSYFFPELCNDPDKQVYRNSKFDYLNYLKTKSIVDTTQFLLTQDTLDQCRNQTLVVKPVNGAGNIDVHIKPDFNTISNLVNSDTIYMVQDYVDGEEFCIEMSSYMGLHKCTMASVYKGEYLVDNIFPWREENELIDSTHPYMKILYEYVVTILDALGVRIGLTWTQVKIKNGTPHLVEINFRSQGRAVVGPIHAVTNNNWALDSLKSYLNINTHNKNNMMYKKLGDFNKICINNYTERYIENLDMSNIKKLDSFDYYEERHNLFPGIIPVTKNFPSVMGMIMIHNNNLDRYTNDMNVINTWKKMVCK